MREELIKAKQKLEELEREFRENAEVFLKTEIEALFEKYPKLNRFYCHVSNHEFNDGDATYFFVGYEDPGLNGVNLWDGSHEGADEDLVDDTELTCGEFKAIGKEINDIFSIIDGQLETLYGGATSGLTFRRDGKVEVD